jgi:GNAT superfamily N-acetyltransferase
VRHFDVEPMRAGEEPAVIAALARAFHDDPLFGFFVPNLVKQMKSLIGFMSSGVKDARPFGDVWAAHADGKVAGARYGSRPAPIREARAAISRPTSGRCRRSCTAASASGARSPCSARSTRLTRRCAGPHYYLAILGTDPEFQRTGAGSAVLAPVLERCDTEGLPAYLETQKEANIAYYARHRFELVQKLEVPGCPPVWTLIREPKPA